MAFDLDAWLGQATTGIGMSGALTTLAAIASGQMTWHQAVVPLIGCVVGVIWPENTPLKSAAETVAGNVEALVSAYRAGLSHGVAAAPDAGPATTPPARQPVAGPTS